MADQVTLYAASKLVRLAAHKRSRQMFRDIKEFGLLPTLLLALAQPEAWVVVRRVKKHILTSADPEREAHAFQKSYAASFNMIGVAGAITAQIAITAVSLPQLEDTHWTAEAGFVISLISGLLSVYFACVMQIRLGALHDGRATLAWLTRRPFLGRAERFLFGPGVTASVSSALLIVAPTMLLHWAIASLLIGLGIYYGLVYSRGLGDLRGDNADLAILLVFILFTTAFVSRFYIPSHWKDAMDLLLQEEIQAQKQDVDSRSRQENSTPSLELGAMQDHRETRKDQIATTQQDRTSRVLEEALRTAIAAQRSTLLAHEALLHSLDLPK